MERKKITAEEIVSIWTHDQNTRIFNNESTVVISDYEISGSIVLEKYGALSSLMLENCQISFFEINIPVRIVSVPTITLRNTEVTHMSLVNVQGKYFRIEEGSKIWNLNLQSCNINNFAFLGGSVLGECQVLQESITGRWLFATSEVGNIIIDGSSKTKHINIDSCKMSAILIIGCSGTQNITIANSIFSGALKVMNAVTENISINNSELSGVIVEEQSNVLSFHASAMTLEHLEFENSIVTSIHLHRSIVFRFRLAHLKSESKRALIQHSFAEQLIVNLDKPYYIGIENSTLGTLRLENEIFPRDSFLQIADTPINHILINSFINQGTMVLSNIRPISTWQSFIVEQGESRRDESGKFKFKQHTSDSRSFFVNSDLGKTSFIGCNLNAYDEFIFLNSKMLDVFIADTVLPKSAKIQTIHGKQKKYQILEQRRLALSQFKKIYENRGDVVNAIEYHAQEMETYREYLKYIKPNSTKEWWNNKGERINLWLNRASSNYGNNWLRAVITTLSMNWALFAVYCLCLGYRPGLNVAKFWGLASYSPEFLNPLRKADFIKDVAPTPWSRVVDYAARIIISYFVYQTIQAFRKFGRKSV